MKELRDLSNASDEQRKPAAAASPASTLKPKPSPLARQVETASPPKATTPAAAVSAPAAPAAAGSSPKAAVASPSAAVSPSTTVVPAVGRGNIVPAASDVKLMKAVADTAAAVPKLQVKLAPQYVPQLVAAGRPAAQVPAMETSAPAPVAKAVPASTPKAVTAPTPAPVTKASPTPAPAPKAVPAPAAPKAAPAPTPAPTPAPAPKAAPAPTPAPAPKAAPAPTLAPALKAAPAPTLAPAPKAAPAPTPALAPKAAPAPTPAPAPNAAPAPNLAKSIADLAEGLAFFVSPTQSEVPSVTTSANAEEEDETFADVGEVLASIDAGVAGAFERIEELEEKVLAGFGALEAKIMQQNEVLQRTLDARFSAITGEIRLARAASEQIEQRVDEQIGGWDDVVKSLEQVPVEVATLLHERFLDMSNIIQEQKETLDSLLERLEQPDNEHLTSDLTAAEEAFSIKCESDEPCKLQEDTESIDTTAAEASTPTEEAPVPATEDKPTVDENDPTMDEDEHTVDEDEPTVDEDEPAVDEDKPTEDWGASGDWGSSKDSTAGDWSSPKVIEENPFAEEPTTEQRVVYCEAKGLEAFAVVPSRRFSIGAFDNLTVDELREKLLTMKVDDIYSISAFQLPKKLRKAELIENLLQKLMATSVSSA
jgi:hypothetical protein